MTDSITTTCDALRAQQHTDIEDGSSLPPISYHCPDVYALEIERVFQREWACVGHVDEIGDPGDYFITDLVGEPLMILRDASGDVAVLSNVCRHRCAQLLEGRGNVSQIVCPYHGWTYSLDGVLRGASHMEHSREFEPTDYRLPAIRVELWNGYIFVNLSGEATPLAPRLEPLQRLIEPFHIDEMRYFFGGEYVWEANWKVITENFTENYHTFKVHPESLNRMNPTRLTKMLGQGEDFHVHIEPYAEDREPLPGPYHPDVPSSERNHVYLFALFPSATYGAHARRTFSFLIHPLGPERSRVKWGLATRAEMTPAEREEVIEVYGSIILEDRKIVERLQAALSSRHAGRGRLSHLEQSTWDLYRYLGKHLLG
jgi:choline monooxygenase